MDIDQFASEHVTTETDAPFQLENSYTLDVTVDGSVPGVEQYFKRNLDEEIENLADALQETIT